MACEVKTFGKIHDFQKVQEYFGLSHDENWMNAINYAISPTGELIALAQGEKLAFLSTCWNIKSQMTTYELSWWGELENPNHIVTSVICLPIFGKNASVGPEWTCVAVGLNSGMVLFYTDAGIKIFSQSYENDPVLNIKSYSPPRHSEKDSFVYIIYDQCVCFIKGADIIPLLCNHRNNHTRLVGLNISAATAANVHGSAMQDMIPYQKFKYPRKTEAVVNDAAVAGTQKPCIYDHIIEQCLGCGYYAKVSENPPQSSLVLGVGAEPYLGFYNAEEGYKTISLGEVAKDVVGMAYKNIFGNLFGRSNAETQADEQPPSPSKESQMRPSCRFYDGKRDGYTIAMAPGNRLAAITDNLDRVMLVDCQRGIILRVFKGYHDAQCAFVPVKERTLKGVQTGRRKALFLVIYAPRMGCLEIWSLQNGPKIAAFTVSKSGQLAYSTHGLLGVQPSDKVKATVNCCLFLDPSDCSLKEIVIPFHFALSESNSTTSRDIHLLRRLKNLLRSDTETKNIADIKAVAAEFQTIEVRQQCLEMLRKNRQLDPEIFQVIAFEFLTALDSETESENLEEKENLRIILQNYLRLVDFYITMLTPIAVDFDDNLELSDSDLVTINQLVLLLANKEKITDAKGKETSSSNNPTTSHVTFQERYKDDGDFVHFLSIFQMDIHDKIPIIHAKSDIFGYISGKLFGEFFDHGLCFEQFNEAAEKTHIPCEDLLVLALHFWIKRPFEYRNCDEVLNDMSRLAAMIRAICELAGDRVNDYAYNAISRWWQAVRELLLESPKSQGLLVAIVCKTVAASLRRSQREGSCDESSQAEMAEERWEQISQDEAQWGLLIGKLEDISVLGAVLEFPISSVDPLMPQLPYETPDCSLKSIVKGGKGIVTDLTAQWLINSRIHPSKIVELMEENKENPLHKDELVNADNCDKDENTTTESIVTAVNDPVLEKLSLLREHFPFSLESGMLLSLMSWHYMVHWSKNLHSLEYFRAALACFAEFKDTDYALKHGMCCLLWNATLKYPLQSTMKLIQKVGRLPKEKMCQQDLYMSSSQVADFLEHALEFLQHFSRSLNHEKRELKFEESLAVGELPLQFIALQQHHAIKEMLQLHTELCTVLHFIAFFQIKIPKPITTLFDAMSNKSFFADINKELNYLLPVPDQILQKAREDFLCTVITASMDVIREDLEQLYVLEHVQYMEKICNLAKSWKLDPSALKRQQVINMYAHGYDAHAEILLKDILDDENIGRMLLEIAGRRLNLYSESSSGVFLKVASVGPQLLQYLDNLRTATSKSIQITASSPDEIDITALTKLTTNAYECLARRELNTVHIAAQMFDACSIIQEQD